MPDPAPTDPPIPPEVPNLAHALVTAAMAGDWAAYGHVIAEVAGDVAALGDLVRFLAIETGAAVQVAATAVGCPPEVMWQATTMAWQPHLGPPGQQG